MGTIFGLFARIFGYHVIRRSYVSSVTNTIDLIPCKKSNRWIWGGLIHSVPVVLVFLMFWFVDSKLVRHDLEVWAALLLASLWGFLGPSCIWIFERITLPKLWLDCSKKISLDTDKRLIRKLIYQNSLDSITFRILLIFWMAAVSFYFFKSQTFVSGFGVGNFNTIEWWVLYIGVIFFSYYSALGILFSIRATIIVRAISKSKILPVPYDSDNSFGFSFVGDFALRTNLMFLTGWLFVPLLTMLSMDGFSRGSLGAFSLIIGYFLFVTIAFVAPILLIHKRLVAIKKVLLIGASSNIQESHVKHEHNRQQATAISFLAFRAIASDIKKMSVWPLNLDTFMRFALGNLVGVLLSAAKSAFSS